MATPAQYQELARFCASRLSLSSGLNLFVVSREQLQTALDALNVVIADQSSGGSFDFSDPSNADNNGLL